MSLNQLSADGLRTMYSKWLSKATLLKSASRTLTGERAEQASRLAYVSLHYVDTLQRSYGVVAYSGANAPKASAFGPMISAMRRLFKIGDATTFINKMSASELQAAIENATASGTSLGDIGVKRIIEKRALHNGQSFRVLDAMRNAPSRDLFTIGQRLSKAGRRQEALSFHQQAALNLKTKDDAAELLYILSTLPGGKDLAGQVRLSFRDLAKA